MAASCVLALALFGSPDRGDHSAAAAPQHGGGQPRPPAAGASTLSAHTPDLDPDGVQRHTGSTGVALTFDDGPDPRWTPAVLDLLHRYRVKATFCLVGEHVAAHPELVRRIAADGHLLCDHTWSHDEALPSRPAAVIRSDLRRTYDAIVAASGGRAPVYYRAPAGRFAPAVLAEARRLTLTPLGWSVDPADWQQPPATVIAGRVLAGVVPGAIVLLHDGYGRRAATVAALRTILAALAARHLTVTTP